MVQWLRLPTSTLVGMSSILVPGLGTKILRCTMQPEIEEEKQGGGENFPAGFALFKNIYIYIFLILCIYLFGCNRSSS